MALVDIKALPHPLVSTIAVGAALLANGAIATAIDQMLHTAQVYPPWGVPMTEVGDNLLALTYRILLGVFSGWLAARWAPSRPLTHALVLGVLGTILSILGLLAARASGLGPLWYPTALAVSALPSTWLGGWLFCRSRSAREGLLEKGERR